MRNDEGDWIGLYEKGVLVREGHSFEPIELLRLIGIAVDDIWDVDLEEFEYHLPAQLSDLEGRGKGWPGKIQE